MQLLCLRKKCLHIRGQIEGDYITRTVENGQLVVVHEDGSTSLVAPTDDMLLRPAIVLSAPDAGTAGSNLLVSGRCPESSDRSENL